jgi:hypothetical protein
MINILNSIGFGMIASLITFASFAISDNSPEEVKESDAMAIFWISLSLGLAVFLVTL